MRPLFPLSLLFLMVMVSVTSQGCSAEAPTTETTSDSPGRIKITGKHAGFDKENKFYLANGEATLTIVGQHSKLTADDIVYELKSGIVTARGNVKIWRNDDLSEARSFKFNIRSGDYLLTEQDPVLIDPAGHRVGKWVPTADDRGSVAASHFAGENFKWTLEKMLMATPMPLTQEERTFLAEHPSLDGICSWKFELFQNYASSEIGRHRIAETAVHWRGIVDTLKKQMTAGSKLLKLKPLPLEAVGKNLDSSSLEQIQALLSAKEAEMVFEQMKVWRQDVAILAPFVESMRDQARANGLEDRFERAVGNE